MQTVNIKDNVSLVLSPGMDLPSFIIQRFNDAKRNIWVMHSDIRDKRVVELLLRAAHRGLEVKVLAGKVNNEVTAILQEGGVEVRLFPPESDSGKKLHHKAIMIDNNSILTGSVNLFERSMERDFESLIELKAKPVYELFKAEFNQIWALSVKQQFDKQRATKKKNSKKQIKRLINMGLNLLLITSLVFNIILLTTYLFRSL